MSKSTPVLTLVVTAFLLSACGKPKSAEERFNDALGEMSAARAQTISAADTASPDSAVKAAWRILATGERLGEVTCPSFRANARPANSAAFYAVITPAFKEKREKVSAAYPCEPTVFERSIDEVKSESETRAVVFATARQTSPVPAKFHDEKSKKGFETGAKLKYVTEKVDGQWRVAEIYCFSRYGGGQWELLNISEYNEPQFYSTSVEY